MKVKILKNLTKQGIESLTDDDFEKQINNTIEELKTVTEIKIDSAYDESRYKVVVTVMLIY